MFHLGGAGLEILYIWAAGLRAKKKAKSQKPMTKGKRGEWKSKEEKGSERKREGKNTIRSGETKTKYKSPKKQVLADLMASYTKYEHIKITLEQYCFFTIQTIFHDISI